MKKVFCKDCKWLKNYYICGDKHVCQVKHEDTKIYDPIESYDYVYFVCENENVGAFCEYYKPTLWKRFKDIFRKEK